MTPRTNVTLRERISPAAALVTSLALIALIGTMDSLVGVEISTSLFYVAPVVLTAWYTGRLAGTCMAVLAAAVWMMTDRLWTTGYSHTSILFWNTFVRLALFSIIAQLTSLLRERLRREEQIARTDPLTGLLNSRAFHEHVVTENSRLRRFNHPYTIAYIDLDNFKTVNDRRGHTEGDRVLQEVGAWMTTGLRDTDLPARLGGDEFAVLMVETPAPAAEATLRKLHAGLLGAMKRRGWPVTFSIGAVTFTAAPDSAGEVIELADRVMYEVKHGCKNAVRHAQHDPDGLSAPRLLEPL
jgi:diguanylate cyclase (GGDEF)-like protein